MAEFDDVLDTESGESGSEGMKNLRKAYEKEKAAREKLAQEYREIVLKQEISTRGLNPKIANFIPKDIDPTELSAWIEENADVFAPVSATPKEESSSEQEREQSKPQANAGQPETGIAGLSPDVVQQLTQIFGFTGNIPTATQLDEVKSKLSGAKTKDEFYKIIQGGTM